MRTVDLAIQGLKLIYPKIFRDERGFFFQNYDAKNYPDSNIAAFVQDNTSKSKKGTIRALHYQEAPGQDKLITCLEGEIFDVAVDLRIGSPTFGKWHSVILNSETFTQFYIPKGFAHGFGVLSEFAIVQYKVSSFYNPSMEKSIRWNDPEIGIQWPIQHPTLSERDQKSPFLKEIFI